LVKVFQQVLERRKEIPKIELQHETVTIAQMMSELRQKLTASDDPISMTNFFESCASRRAMIVAFLAVLEMVRLQAVKLVQSALFSDILLRKHQMFDVVFSGDEAIAKIEEQYQ
jgi:segregation and condensation protein A